MEGAVPKPIKDLLLEKRRMSLVRTAMVSVNNAASALAGLHVVVQALAAEYDSPNQVLGPVQDALSKVVDLMQMVEQLN